ncbi:MAG: glycosyltransferase family 4 protein [Muribaculaceae bacterium]|nr:glycosyltransferase family 4 protein [Muribaculaceae bacterium]
MNALIPGVGYKQGCNNKVVKIIHIVSGNAMGGAQRYALDICRHYSAEGHDVLALTRDAKAIDRHFREAGVALAHAPLRDYPDLFSSLTLSQLLKNSPQGATIVHVHRYRDALTAMAARRMAGRPDVGIVVTRHVAEKGKNNWLRRLIYRGVDAHICVSAMAKREFLSAWPHGRYPFDTARLHVLFNSRNIIPRREDIPAKGAVTAMFHGTLRPGKGLETLIEALGKLKDTRLRLKIVGTGDPDFVDALRRRSQALGIMDRIDWIRIAEDPMPLIASCHFGVLPSETPEAFGMANMEYMAAGRGQISTFNGAQSEYLRPGLTALKVAPGDADALAEAMRTLYADKELCRRMGQAAGEHYDAILAWPGFITRLDEIYRGVASATPPPMA